MAIVEEMFNRYRADDEAMKMIIGTDQFVLVTRLRADGSGRVMSYGLAKSEVVDVLKNIQDMIAEEIRSEML